MDDTMTDWKRDVVEQRIADLNRAIIRQFTIEGEIEGPPRLASDALGLAFECLDAHDLAGAEHWCDVAERRIIEEGVALRRDPEAWLRRVRAQKTK